MLHLASRKYFVIELEHTYKTLACRWFCTWRLTNIFAYHINNSSSSFLFIYFLKSYLALFSTAHIIFTFFDESVRLRRTIKISNMSPVKHWMTLETTTPFIKAYSCKYLHKPIIRNTATIGRTKRCCILSTLFNSDCIGSI